VRGLVDPAAGSDVLLAGGVQYGGGDRARFGFCCLRNDAVPKGSDLEGCFIQVKAWVAVFHAGKSATSRRT
jgi:hypothetical protein